MPPVLEFFSLPGAGKTTLANSVAARRGLKTRGDLSAAWNDQGRTSKLGQIIGSFLGGRCNAAAVHLAISAKIRNQESIFRLGRLLAKRKWVAERPDPIILDQGFLQDLWSILYSADELHPDPNALSALIACLYEGMRPRIIYIEVDPQSAAERIANRQHGDSRLDGLPEKQVAERLVATAAIPEALIQAAQAAGLPVERIDGSRPVQLLVDRLCQ